MTAQAFHASGGHLADADAPFSTGRRSARAPAADEHEGEIAQ